MTFFLMGAHLNILLLYQSSDNIKDSLFVDGKFLEGQTITLEDGTTAIVQGSPTKCMYDKLLALDKRW